MSLSKNYLNVHRILRGIKEMFKMIRYILIKISPCSGSRPTSDNKVVFVIKYSKLYKKLLFF